MTKNITHTNKQRQRDPYEQVKNYNNIEPPITALLANQRYHISKAFFCWSGFS